jgi:hypothetical protein
VCQLTLSFHGGGHHLYFIEGICQKCAEKVTCEIFMLVCCVDTLLMYFLDFWIHSQAALLHCQSIKNSLSFVFSLGTFQERDALSSQKKLEKHRNGRGEYIYHCTWILVTRAISKEFFAGRSFWYFAYIFSDVTFSASCHKYLDKLVGSDTSDDVRECRSHTIWLLLMMQLTSCWLFSRHNDVCVGW